MINNFGGILHILRNSLGMAPSSNIKQKCLLCSIAQSNEDSCLFFTFSVLNSREPLSPTLAYSSFLHFVYQCTLHCVYSLMSLDLGCVGAVRKRKRKTCKRCSTSIQFMLLRGLPSVCYFHVEHLWIL